MDGATQREEVFAYDGWRRARRFVLDAVPSGNRAGVLVVVGVPGSGKSLLLRRVLRALRSHGARVRLASGAVPHPAQDGDALLIDDADRLDDAALLGLRTRGGACVLAAGPGLFDRLVALGLPARPVTLDPMSPAEVAAFVRARLMQAGVTPNPLSDDTIASLTHWSGGAPGKLIALITALYSPVEFPDDPSATPPDPVPEPGSLPTRPAPIAAPLPTPPIARAERLDPPAPPSGPERRILIAAAVGALLAVSVGSIGLRRPPALPALRPLSALTVAHRHVADRLPPLPRQAVAVPPPPALPSAAPPQVTLADHPGDAEAPARAALLLRRLAADHIPARDAGSASPDAAPGVHYAFVEDGAAAARVARVLGWGSATLVPVRTALPGYITVVMPPPDRFAGP